MTSKDLDYLQDAFNWNMNSYKIINEKVNSVKNSDLKEVLINAVNVCYKNMKDINFFLKENVNE